MTATEKLLYRLELLEERIEDVERELDYCQDAYDAEDLRREKARLERKYYTTWDSLNAEPCKLKSPAPCAPPASSQTACPAPPAP